MPDRTIFTVHIGAEKEAFTDLEEAIRYWDREGKVPDGGISVQTWHGDLMVRDGWVLHVLRGSAYLNPNIMLK